MQLMMLLTAANKAEKALIEMKEQHRMIDAWPSPDLDL
jgi:hypothetical protein